MFLKFSENSQDYTWGGALTSKVGGLQKEVLLEKALIKETLMKFLCSHE